MAEARKVDPLQWNVAIAKPETGLPTERFMRIWDASFNVTNDLGDLLGVNLIAGAGLSGGGSLGDLTDITFALNVEFVQDLVAAMFTPGGNFTYDDTAGEVDLSTTGVTPGSYTNADITIDEFGRISAAADGGGGGSSMSEFYPNGFTFVVPAAASMTLTKNTGVTTAALVDLASGRGFNLANLTAGSAAFARASIANANVGNSSFTALFHAKEQMARDGNWGSAFGVYDSAGKFTGYGMRNGQVWRVDSSNTNDLAAFSNLGFLSAFSEGTTVPYWVKIVLAGGTFTASISEDGETFYQIDSRSATAYISGTRSGIAAVVDSDSGNSKHSVSVFHFDAV